VYEKRDRERRRSTTLTEEQTLTRSAVISVCKVTEMQFQMNDTLLHDTLLKCLSFIFRPGERQLYTNCHQYITLNFFGIYSSNWSFVSLEQIDKFVYKNVTHTQLVSSVILSHFTSV